MAISIGVPVQAGAFVIKSSPGVLHRVTVTVVAATAVNFFDNASAASGTVIAAIPASQALGSILIFEMPFSSGLTMSGSGSNPGLTVSFD